MFQAQPFTQVDNPPTALLLARIPKVLISS